MEVHCAKMVDYTKQVNDTGSIQLATLPKSGLTKKNMAEWGEYSEELPFFSCIFCFSFVDVFIGWKAI